MIPPWTRNRTARQVRALVGDPVMTGPWLVIDQPDLARALSKGPDSVQVVETPSPDGSEPPGGLAAVVAPLRLVDDASAPERLAAWRRAVRVGGVIILVGRTVVTAGDVPGAPSS